LTTICPNCQTENPDDQKFCGSIDIIEQRGMCTTTIKCDKPGDVPQEIKLKILDWDISSVYNFN
jgi:hypothetical protein